MEKILVVDDSRGILDLLEAVLVESGYQVFATTSGREALRQMDRAPFDLVITDVIMPDVDGLEIITKIKKRLPAIPVVVISGGGTNAPEVYTGLAQKFGAARTFHKPFDVAAISTAVQELLTI